MKNYVIHHEWKIIEEGFKPELNRISESLFSIGNGKMGQRANFEEKYSGDTMNGTYVAGIYYPDKTRVGWWKNGYPEYFAKIINSTNWIGIGIKINGEELDLATAKVLSFTRELDMQHGLLSRRFVAELKNGNQIEVCSHRFVSVAATEIGAIRYTVKALNFSGEIEVSPFLDGDVVNEDSNYDEKFWVEVSRAVGGAEGYLTVETLKTEFQVCTGMWFQLLKNGEKVDSKISNRDKEKYVEALQKVKVSEGGEIVVEKLSATVSSLYYEKENLVERTKEAIDLAVDAGYDALFESHKNRWLGKWKTSDIKIEGDVAAQQGIRFNIFQLNQTYSGEDERLNIGPKGFTGEKYGGVTYWDTEAYCLPFYLSTAPQKVSKNLLVYRHKHLQKAIENAEKLGFKNGAALYPMVTINGEECHNEWEITFEEIHRNGAIAYAIYDYINYTGDKEYLAPTGFEVLLGISRFWSQRVNWSAEKQRYVMLGVTGPNEYENNVNNNFHTSYIAVWTLKYTLEVIDYLKKEFPFLFEEMVKKWKFNELTETEQWKDIIEKMYYPRDEKRGIYLQQDGFLDKDLTPVAELSEEDLPINQKWSWDRILRSPYIKQADTLQSLYLFQENFTSEELKSHFDFYEPLTVHESSLSPCIHSILAARIGYQKKSYEMYLRTARLDLDDYNNDTEDGLHITSMGGTWMSFVMGFGGMRVVNGRLTFNPFIPESWKSYAFRIDFGGAHLEVTKTASIFSILNHSEIEVPVTIWGEEYRIKGNEIKEFKK
ncbi:family 65 glycosyl hydrolase domain-containing protein [Prolixibacteraceae bacterium Z1-6]|uniref:Family 65 glycosyl hydrolase domain-containing protein n=1 Tax=Draconibacterium aestuarii TaxID=2998507 RepID=A0A9X3F5U1_9BACT|nr:family 65 glycosyl hydrolase domain-containing protein [Prolixibacteraceae bacterium Z1-6]